MILEKYKPKTTKEIISNQLQIREIGNWIKKWKKGALIIHGPPGSGKSLSIEILAKAMRYEIIEYSSSDIDIDHVLKTSQQTSLFFQGKLIVIETDKVPIKITNLIKNTRHPVILIVQDAYKIKPAIRKYCKLIKFTRIRYDLIARLLDKICEQENVKCNKRLTTQLARMSNGDVRAALIDLESLIDTGSINNISHREQDEDIFNTLKIIFRTKDINNARTAIKNCDKSVEEISLWLEENIPEEYDKQASALAYEYLAKADLFASRIMKRQLWSLKKYTLLAPYGTAISKKEPKKSYVSYKFPLIFFKKKNNEETKEKIARKLHISKKEVNQELPLIKKLLNKELISELNLNEKDIEELTAC